MNRSSKARNVIWYLHSKSKVSRDKWITKIWKLFHSPPQSGTSSCSRVSLCLLDQTTSVGMSLESPYILGSRTHWNRMRCSSRSSRTSCVPERQRGRMRGQRQGMGGHCGDTPSGPCWISCGMCYVSSASDHWEALLQPLRHESLIKIWLACELSKNKEKINK